MAKLEGDIYRMEGLKAIFRNSGNFDLINENAGCIGHIVERTGLHTTYLCFRPSMRWFRIANDYRPETLEKIVKLIKFIEKSD